MTCFSKSLSLISICLVSAFAATPTFAAPNLTTNATVPKSNVIANNINNIALDELNKWQQQENIQVQTTKAIKLQDALLHSPSTPVFNKNGKISVIVFSDYQCIYCARAVPLLETLAQENPNVRIVFKEWPIFSSRWPASLEAAQTALAVWHDNKNDNYWNYHNAIYETGHNEGSLSSADIKKTLTKLKLPKLSINDQYIEAELRNTNDIAMQLGLHGTPAFIIMPNTHSSKANITILPGMPNAEVLKAAVYRASLVSTDNEQ